MPETPGGHQEQNRKTDEEIRRERIAAIGEPDLRKQLEGMVCARDAELAEISRAHAEEFERSVAAKMASRASAARDPNYRGFAVSATREACTQAVQVEDRAELESAAKLHNDTIDEKLEGQREQTREPRQVSQQMEETQSDQSRSQDARFNAPQAEEERQPQGVKREQGHAQRPIDSAEHDKNPVDWRRILKDPDYRREVQVQEFTHAGSEVTEGNRAARQSEGAAQSQAPHLDQKQSQSGSVETQSRKEVEREEVDWRRALKDPDYRREVQAQEIQRTGRELTQRENRQASVSPEY